MDIKNYNHDVALFIMEQNQTTHVKIRINLKIKTIF